MIKITAVLIILVSSILGAIGSLFLKKSTKQLSFSPLKLIKNQYLIAGSLLFFASTIIYIVILKYLDLSLAFPLTATSYIWVFILSKIYLKERITKFKILGMVLIIIGAILISLS